MKSKCCFDLHVRLILKKYPSQKRASRMAEGVGPEFKPQYCKRKKKVVLIKPNNTKSGENVEQ
jgi:hypothetical protein